MFCGRHLLYALTSALCFVLPQSAGAETVREAIENALANHPAIDIATSQQDVADENRREEVSNLYPEIYTSATGGRMYGNNSTTRGLTVSRGQAYSWLWEGNASITQPLFNGFETYNRIDAAEARQSAAEFTLADARQGTALRAAQAFLNVRRAKEAYEKTSSYQGRIKDYLSRIKSMVDAGAADEAESAQAKNIQAQLDNTAAEMEGQVKLALADYAEATGSMPSGELRGGDEVGSLMLKDINETLQYATTNHPLVLSAQKNLEAEDEEVSAEKGVLLPDLDGELSYLKRDQKEEIGGEVDDGRAVMRMSWGFSTGGGQLARIRKSKAERSEALARIAQTKRQIERDIRRAFAEYETAEKQKELNAKRAVVTKELFQTYEKQFEASKVRLLQLMQAENQVFTAELEQINSNYRVMMAEYTTLASSGRLLEILGVEAQAAQSIVVEQPQEEISEAKKEESAKLALPFKASKSFVYEDDSVEQKDSQTLPAGE